MQVLLEGDGKTAIFSNLVEQDSGLVTAGDIYTSSHQSKDGLFNNRNKVGI